MKQPNLRHLKIDRQGTELIRTAFRKRGRGTVNLDVAELRAAKTRFKKAGIPYQRIVKTLLSTTVSQQKNRFNPAWHGFFLRVSETDSRPPSKASRSLPIRPGCSTRNPMASIGSPLHNLEARKHGIAHGVLTSAHDRTGLMRWA